MKTLRELLATLPQRGRVAWIAVRPGREQAMIELESVRMRPGEGLEGDRFSGTAQSKRQVTLLQQEHLRVIGSILNRTIDPALLRRNVLVAGINLLALQRRRFRIGSVTLEGTGPCHPCSKMEAVLGPGGYNAMRGHGGITARVLCEGVIAIGDEVALL